MNYEEKYKEMKKRVLAIGQGYVKEVDYSSPRSIAEYIDPELRESEDERIKKDIVDFLSVLASRKENQTFSSEDFDIDSLNKWIQWLEKQGEQTHTWNEEDEKKIMWLVRLISTAGYRELDNDKMPCSRLELLDWLKSLKPNHWKPSEEQMEALKKRTHGLHTSSETRKALESLINDLKTL